MAAGIGIFGTEGRAKGIDETHGQSAQLPFELSRHGEMGRFAEEIFAVINGPCFCLWRVEQIEGGYIKHGAGSFAIAGCYNGCMQPEKPPVVVKLMYGKSHGMANTKYSTKSICTHPQVGVFT
ncbi:MAG: hypothetical protein BWY70_01657 [Bacteroidetes bacterium ADurb.Bin408]|nr:MAG: hypothetical protein BWY70_01657 [Bacteroidetes bacterium ADurb.Bin408]